MNQLSLSAVFESKQIKQDS